MIRLADQEYAEIERQAAHLHLSKVDYIRARIFAYRLPSQRSAVDDEMYRRLSQFLLDARVAERNMNRLTDALNLGGHLEVQETLACIAQLRKAVDQVRLHLVKIAADFEAGSPPSDDTYNEWEMEDE